MNVNWTVAVFCLCVACFVGGVSSSAPLKDLPGCTFPEAEKCGYDFVPYFVKATLPEDAKGLATLCKHVKTQLKCAVDFSDKCLEGLPKGVISLMLMAVGDEYAMFCNTTNPKHKEYLDSIKCLNKAGQGIQKCAKDMFVAMFRASKAPDRQKIAYSCCYYEEFIECAEEALRKGCKHPAARKFFHDILDHVFGEVLGLACGKYKKGTGACETLPALPTKDDAKVRNKGFIEPLAIISSKLG
ncbi:hypothetical protein HPB50_000222 [Hyalomma asiaticum]|uniref:Uncharacterized protein n=1 Tax=Hyalomma asiaticum TaxID=266040 RepID=A0ACB7RTC5_HYAAI|nr:hypothetical protein HPB50_000222 [Hyalomma asiaticum]